MNYTIKKFIIVIGLSFAISLGQIPYTDWIVNTFPYPLLEIGIDFIILRVILSCIYVLGTVLPSAVLFGYIFYRIEKNQ